MTTYVIFNKKSGAIVHAHAISDELLVNRDLASTKALVMAIVAPEHRREDLDFTIVDPATIDPGRLHSIDVATGKLRVAEEGKVQGFGSAASSRVNRPQPTRTVFEPHKIGHSRPK